MLTIKHAEDTNKDYVLCKQNKLTSYICMIKTILLSWFTRNTKNWHISFVIDILNFINTLIPSCEIYEISSFTVILSVSRTNSIVPRRDVDKIFILNFKGTIVVDIPNLIE